MKIRYITYMQTMGNKLSQFFPEEVPIKHKSTLIVDNARNKNGSLLSLNFNLLSTGRELRSTACSLIGFIGSDPLAPQSIKANYAAWASTVT